MGDGLIPTSGSGQACLLTTVAPEGLHTVDQSGWVLVEAAVDSGATENVMGEKDLRSVATRDGEASKRGVTYEVANGKRIPNLGEKQFVAHTAEGLAKGITCQVCDVNRPLLSVSKIVAAGHRVTFGPEGGHIQDLQTGELMHLKQENGMYTLAMWVQSDKPF